MFHHESAGRKRARDLLSRTGHHLGKAGGHMKDHVSEHMDKGEDVALIKKAFKEHDDQLHEGKPTRLKLADGGIADGAMADGRADKAPRGKSGGKGAKNHVNIIIAPQAGQSGGGQGGPPGGLPPMAAHPPMPAPPPPMPPRPPMAPPPGGPPPGMGAGLPPGLMPPGGGPPPGMPPGGMPMRKSGGRADRTHGESESTAADMPWSAETEDEHGPMKMERRPQEIETAEAQRAKRARGGEVGSGRVPNMTAGSGSGEGRLEKSKALPY